MTMQDAARTALQVQDACNLSGVLRTWLECRDAVNAACDGTAARNTHPIHVLFANKVADLTHQICDPDAFGPAYDACLTLARGDA